jgi:flagellar biosynthetic protein FliP
MMTLLIAARAAVPATSPLLPDLNARLHPSDSTPWTILFTLTLITLLPAILMCMTPLVRLMVVFHFLRQALGTQTAPSNPTLLGLGLMMTWFLMTPVLGQVDQLAVQPAQHAVAQRGMRREPHPRPQGRPRHGRHPVIALEDAGVGS